MNAIAAAQAAEKAGDWRDAYQRYRAIIDADARNAMALRGAGLTAYRLGRPAEALERLRQALAIETNADLLLDYAALLQELGQWAPAEAAYRAALKLAPLSVDGRFGRACCLHQAGRYEPAAAAYRSAAALLPQVAVFYDNLGRALLGAGRAAAAAAADALERAVRLTPSPAASLWNVLGSARRQAGRDGAESAWRAALRCDPAHESALSNLHQALGDERRPRDAVNRRLTALRPADVGALNGAGVDRAAAGDWAAAAVAFDRAGRADSQAPDPALNLADALTRLNQQADALAALRRAQRLAPQAAAPYRLLGGLRGQALDHRGAAAAFRCAAALSPNDAEIFMDLGGAALRCKRADLAEPAFRRVLALAPNSMAALGHLTELKTLACDWPAALALERRLLTALRAGAGAVSPFLLLGLPNATAKDQLAAATAWARVKTTRAPRLRRPPPAPRLDGRIRVGYLSSDFREHAIAYLLAGVLAAHDRGRFDIRAYSIGPDDDGPTRRRIVASVERFVDLSAMGDAAAAQALADDDLDLLVDVNGYTAFARTTVVAARPAPLTVNWLGYPGTLGAGFADYILADATAIPPGEEAHYGEAVVRLPFAYQPNDRRRVIDPAAPSRAECGLPDAAFVFCCFNNLYKISAEVFACWLDILRQTPGAVLWLMDGPPQAVANLRRAALAGGVAAERLIFAPPAPLPQHLARHRLADLFLDTLPYNAHTTASDALWAGLPVLTRRGNTFAGRVAASLTAAAGLPEMAVDDREAYIATALKLATNPDALAALKARLAAQRFTCPLFDDVRFARHLEAAFAAMHADRLAGRRPRRFSVNDDGSICFDQGP